jgi:spore maturation protein CgeB
MLKQTLRSRFYKLVIGKRRPIITSPRGQLTPGQAAATFVVIVGPFFNQTIPNAGTTARMGWCHGFEQLGIPYLLMSVFDLAQCLPEIPNPLCWISGADYEYLNRVNLAALKKQRHVVWVNTWFEGAARFCQAHNLENNSWPEELNRKILSSEPALMFTISPTRSFEYYQGWLRQGAQLISLPLACDTTLYHDRVPFCPEFADVQLAFVGGFWPYKARQFDRYLKPYADRLTVFGYSAWPYAGYGGQLPEAKEPALYRQARLSPTINEPHVEVMGVDLNERVFKVLGSGGLTITDVTPGYREWFDQNELLVPDSVSDYHEMVRLTLTDQDFSLRYRQAGQRAIQERHTYAHRARTLLELLGLAIVPEANASSVDE